jgi:hypothetical protein
MNEDDIPSRRGASVAGQIFARWIAEWTVSPVACHVLSRDARQSAGQQNSQHVALQPECRQAHRRHRTQGQAEKGGDYHGDANAQREHRKQSLQDTRQNDASRQDCGQAN